MGQMTVEQWYGMIKQQEAPIFPQVRIIPDGTIMYLVEMVADTVRLLEKNRE